MTYGGTDFATAKREEGKCRYVKLETEPRGVSLVRGATHEYIVEQRENDERGTTSTLRRSIRQSKSNLVSCYSALHKSLDREGFLMIF